MLIELSFSLMSNFLLNAQSLLKQGFLNFDTFLLGCFQIYKNKRVDIIGIYFNQLLGSLFLINMKTIKQESV